LAEVSLRPAGESDLELVSAWARHPDAEAFLMPGAGEEGRLREFWLGGGLYVAALGRAPVAALGLEVVSARSRICALSRLVVDPGRRRQGIGLATVAAACRLALGEQGQHRVQAETYGDNLAGQRLFEAAGFTREGVRRRAYWRRERWIDGVLFGILADELI
jgi:RimJ/RimL family protein N-acetyltransferase